MPRHLQQRNRADTVIAMASQTMRYLVRTLSMSAVGAALAFSVASCNNQTGFSGSVGNTPNGPALTSYEILGTIGTPFTAIVSDAQSSWVFQGNVPLSVIICNNTLPARIVATKTSNNNNLLSLQIINGGVSNIQSTSAPFGNVSVQTDTLNSNSISPSALSRQLDLRIFVSGPFSQRYTALVEDTKTGYVISSRAPTLILFDTPEGKVDATFYGKQNYGTFTVNMTFNGAVVATVVKGPNATIREP